MGSTDNLKKLVSDLNDDKTSANAVEFISVIVRNWCRKNKLEIKWIAFDDMPTIDTEFCKMVHCNTKELIRDNKIHTYKDFRSLVLRSAEELLSKGFRNFNHLLLKKNNLAWKYVAEQLLIYAFKWYRSRNFNQDIDVVDLHWSAMNTLFEKQDLKKLQFKNSFELKSYYFRILENKMKEKFRKIKKENLISNVLPDLFYEINTSEEDDLMLVLKQEIKNLTENEQYILQEYFVYEKKLTEIAEKLEISADNCRVIKHRTIKRLSERIQRYKTLTPSG